jgi:hypothetical protein
MQYMVTGSDGIEYGPVDDATLKSWAGEGRVIPNTKVRDVMSQQVYRATDMPVLKGVLPDSAPIAPTNYQVPPSMADGYPRGMPYVPQVKSGTRLWMILFWAFLGIGLSIFTHRIGVISIIYMCIRAWKAHEEEDDHKILCLVVAVVSVIIMGIFTVIGFKERATIAPV